MVATAQHRAHLKPLFHSSQTPTRKLAAASAFKYCDWMKVLAASLRVGFFAMSGKEWKSQLAKVESGVPVEKTLDNQKRSNKRSNIHKFQAHRGRVAGLQ